MSNFSYEICLFCTKHNKLSFGLHSSKWVFELDLYFPCVCLQTVSEQQPTVIGLPHDLNSSSVFELSAILKPTDQQRFLRSKGHLKGSVLPHFYYNRLGELVKVVWVKFRYIYKSQSIIQFNALEQQCHFKHVLQ